MTKNRNVEWRQTCLRHAECVMWHEIVVAANPTCPYGLEWMCALCRNHKRKIIRLCSTLIFILLWSRHLASIRSAGINKKKIKRQNEINSKIVAVPRSLWQEVQSVHAWKTDLLAPKRNPFSLQPLLLYWKTHFHLAANKVAHLSARSWGLEAGCICS